MSKSLQAIRGMNDLLPGESNTWQFVESSFQLLMQQYGYAEIRMPIVEKTELFERSIGEVTDIVEKEMYTFEDRNGDSLTLRPEATASCVRACLQHGLIHNQSQRLWYMGPMFRHERPQKGRYRQFHQMGVEVFGYAGPDIDAELITMSARFWKLLGISDQIRLELNSLGTDASRQAYKKLLVMYLNKREQDLDEDSLRRLTTNPLRILDSKNPKMQPLISAAPKLIDHLDDESKQYFDTLCRYLDALGITYKINTSLVRGLDYYSQTVFEWVTDALGAQGSVCAGGRYDGLVENLGGRPTRAIGFAMGLERLVALIEQTATEFSVTTDVYMIRLGDAAQFLGAILAEKIRDEVPDIKLLLHCGGGSVKSQMKRADKSGAKYAFILGDEEIQEHSITIKHLRNDEPQQCIKQDQVNDFFKSNLGK